MVAITTTRAGNFKFTYMCAGNLHTQVLANAIADLPVRGKYTPLTKTINI